MSIKPTLPAERCGQTPGEVEINRIRARLASLEAERAELESLLAEIEQRRPVAPTISGCSVQAVHKPNVTTASPTVEKVALFRSLFAGRSDVFPIRWENHKTGKAGYAPACANEWIRGVCGKPQIKCGECPHQAFTPVTDEIIDKHLRGGDGRQAFVAGVYPMLPDETCWFLAADFDKESWAADARAMVETCNAKGVPAALERSRSGNGAHVWIFFSEPVPARTARQLGAAIMTETMERRPEIGFASYDRFFPSQDTMPVGGSVIVKEVGPSAMMLNLGPFRDGSGGEVWTCRSAEISRTPNTWSCKVVFFSDNRPRDITLTKVGAPCSMDVTSPPA